MSKRKNCEWDIIMGVQLPIKYGERPCEVVIGDRHTDFEPYVAWHCFDGKSYSWGHYCDTLDQAIECAIEKVRMELGCDINYAGTYWERWHEDWRDE